MSEVPYQFLDIADRLRRNERVKRRSVQSLLKWFGAARRGDVVVSKIRAALLSAGLETDPDFTEGTVNDSITFRLSGATPKADSTTADRKPGQVEPTLGAPAEAETIQPSTHSGDRVKIEVTVDSSGSMLDAEESILRAVNAVGNVATAEALKGFDADGDPIVVGGTKAVIE